MKLKTRGLIKGDSNTVVLRESYKIFKNTLFHKTPPLATSEDQRKTRQVPNLKIIFLKEVKFTDSCRSLLKTLFFRHDFIILLFFHIN